MSRADGSVNNSQKFQTSLKGNDKNLQKFSHRGFILKVAAHIACVARVSVRFRSKEQGTKVRGRAKNGASKRTGRRWEKVRVRVSPFPPLPPLSFFGARSISRAAKTENPVPRSFFAPKSNGNACYAGTGNRISSTDTSR